MGAPEAKHFKYLVERNDYRSIASELVRLEVERGVISISELGADPESAVAGSPELDLEYETNLAQGCSVYGFYRYREGQPSVILVHPSLTAERDNFTIVHEYGHHVQRHHRDWVDVRYSLPATRGEKVEERVADAFASTVLIPEDALPTGTNRLSARALASVHGRVRASRSAVANRVVEVASSEEDCAVVVCDEEGRVIFARATGSEVFTPARGIVQPGLATMFQSAASADGHVIGDLAEGLRALSGWIQTELSADVALDFSGAYAFVVLRPVQVFGREQSWAMREHECVNPACGIDFVVDGSVQICGKCRDPKCPECSTCSCEPAADAFCKACFIALSVAEQSGQVEHVCD